MPDEPTARFIGGVAPRAMCWRQLMTMIGSWHAHGFAMFSVIEKETRPLGRPARAVAAGRMARTRDRLGDRPRPLGPRLCRRGRRRRDRPGRSTRSAGPGIIHSIAPANLASQRVAEKLGSRNLGPGTLPAPFANDRVDLWGQTREEWRARAAAESPRGGLTECFVQLPAGEPRRRRRDSMRFQRQPLGNLARRLAM